MKKFFLFIIVAVCAMDAALAQSKPVIDYSWVLIDGTGEEVQTQDMKYEGSAPITATMTIKAVYIDETGEKRDCAEAEFHGGWRVWREGGQMESPEIVRNETESEFYFTSFGTDSLAYVGYMAVGNDTTWLSPMDVRMSQHVYAIRTYESKLVYPNAFSPNDDGYNDVLLAKEIQSIVEFSAAIYNRWGQKLYEWSNVNQGWDGKSHGKDVKDGVYYLQVKARGSDGHIFNIRKDIMLMRTYDTNYIGNNNTAP